MIWSFSRLRYKVARRTAAIIDRSRERRGFRQWGLLIGPGAGPDFDRIDLESLTPLFPDRDRFWADPFLLSDGDRRVVFFEELRYERPRGEIMALEFGLDGRPAGPPVTALAEPYHLSYPFVFEHQGDFFMLPEASSGKRVDVYCCKRFPDRWERAATLIDGQVLKDCTLFAHDGLWWLFCAAERPGMRVNETLFAFYSDDPLSTAWTPHPMNPIVRSFAGARPGGRIQRDVRGRLIRPAQNCVPRYGAGLVINEILELTPERFHERSVLRLSGKAVSSSGHNWVGAHHLDWQGGLIAMDVQRFQATA